MLIENNRQSDTIMMHSNHYWNRRKFLKIATILALLVSLPSKLWAYFVGRLGVRTVEKNDFYFDSDSRSIVWKETSKREAYILKVQGLVENHLSISYQELLNLPQVEQTSDFHCVEGWSVQDILWKRNTYSFTHWAKRKPNHRDRTIISNAFLFPTCSIPERNVFLLWR
jgi:hypothetical protein